MKRVVSFFLISADCCPFDLVFDFESPFYAGVWKLEDPKEFSTVFMGKQYPVYKKGKRKNALNITQPRHWQVFFSDNLYLSRSLLDTSPPWAMTRTIGSSSGSHFFGGGPQCPEDVKDLYVFRDGILGKQNRDRWELTCDKGKQIILNVCNTYFS